jgi:hypothetical protein
MPQYGLWIAIFNRGTDEPDLLYQIPGHSFMFSYLLNVIDKIDLSGP